eukprot:7617404-Karenia_brevis.AAC.1
MKVVTRRKSRFERNKQVKGVNLMANYTSREGCECNDKYCKRDKWIQPVEKEDAQKMILDFQVAE